MPTDDATTYYRKGFGLKAEVQDTLTGDYSGNLVDLLRANDYTLAAGGVTVRLAREFGFCYGVERAVEYAYQTRAKFPDRTVYLAGEIIHNPHVNAKLREMGIHFLQPNDAGGFDYSIVRPEDVVILPAFGVTIQDFQTLRELGCIMVDTTCGSVLNVWKRVESYARDGYTSLIHGKHYHEETRATASQVGKYAGSHWLVVRDMAEAHLVCDYIEGKWDRASFLAKFTDRASPGFDPDQHLLRVGVANRRTGRTPSTRSSRSRSTSCSSSAATTRATRSRSRRSAPRRCRRSTSRTPRRSIRRPAWCASARSARTAARTCAPAGSPPPATCASGSRPAPARRTTRSARRWRASSAPAESTPSSSADRVHAFARYIALGDGLGGDLAPSLDLKRGDVAVALERDAGAGELPPVGAASLLFANDEELWPDFVARDLRTLAGTGTIVRRNMDGATLGDIFDGQVLTFDGDDLPTLVTLTAGGIDLQSAMTSRPSAARLEAIAHDTAQAIGAIAALLHDRFESCTLVLTTLPDPTDGLGRFPDPKDGIPVPPDVLHGFNAAVRAIAQAHPSTLVGEVHARLTGHGLSAPEEERWFWRRSPYEPGALGASLVREAWLEALGL